MNKVKSDARRAGMLAAAEIADKTVCDTHPPTGIKIYGRAAGKAIREAARS
jgi:hypothetical protein